MSLLLLYDNHWETVGEQQKLIYGIILQNKCLTVNPLTNLSLIHTPLWSHSYNSNSRAVIKRNTVATLYFLLAVTNRATWNCFRDICADLSHFPFKIIPNVIWAISALVSLGQLFVILCWVDIGVCRVTVPVKPAFVASQLSGRQSCLEHRF